LDVRHIADFAGRFFSPPAAGVKRASDVVVKKTPSVGAAISSLAIDTTVSCGGCSISAAAPPTPRRGATDVLAFAGATLCQPLGVKRTSAGHLRESGFDPKPPLYVFAIRGMKWS
jgi:hypothetical protein